MMWLTSFPCFLLTPHPPLLSSPSPSPSPSLCPCEYKKEEQNKVRSSRDLKRDLFKKLKRWETSSIIIISITNPHSCQSYVLGHASKMSPFPTPLHPPTTLCPQEWVAWARSRETTEWWASRLPTGSPPLPPPPPPPPPRTPTVSNIPSSRSSSPAKISSPLLAAVSVAVEESWLWVGVVGRPRLIAMKMRIMRPSSTLLIWTHLCRWSSGCNNVEMEEIQKVFGRGGLVGLLWRLCSSNPFIFLPILFNPTLSDHKNSIHHWRLVTDGCQLINVEKM